MLLNGCSTPRQMVNYWLTEPTAPLVRQWVKVDDQLEFVLKDRATRKLTVSEVTETAIRGNDGTTVRIDNVQEMKCTSTQHEMTGSTEAMSKGMLEGAAPWIGVIVLPVVLVMKLSELAQAPIQKWPDAELCRVSNHPGHYGYEASGVNGNEDQLPSLESVHEEIERRRLNCDSLYLAEANCAKRFTHGPTFSKCAKTVEPLERAGPDGVQEWDDQLLCEAQSGMRSILIAGHSLAGVSSFRDVISKEAERRDPDGTIICSEPSQEGQPIDFVLIMHDSDKWKLTIQFMQIGLLVEGLYDGPFDGVMNLATWSAVLEFKKAKGIPGNTTLDIETLMALGVPASQTPYVSATSDAKR